MGSTLVSGQDTELKAAYQHFHRMVQREQGIVRNAILKGVERVKLDATSVHAVATDNLDLA